MSNVQLQTASRSDANTEVEGMIRKNQLVAVNELTVELKISQHHREVLQFLKVSARWVPKKLTPDLNESREDVCEILFFSVDGDVFLRHVVTGDERWA